MTLKNYDFRRLDTSYIDVIKMLFINTFSNEPWNDDWSDEEQLNLYIRELTSQDNSLVYGLFDSNELIGLSMGHVRHWYTDTEYFIDELCISTSRQGSGAGTFFVKMIETDCRKFGINQIFLLTDKNVPAFQFYRKRGFSHLEQLAALVKNIK